MNPGSPTGSAYRALKAIRREADIAIIGGGPAGAAAAIRLARAGRDVVLFERTTGAHDKVCGEFLDAATIDELRMLGVEPAALGATPIDTIGIIRGKRIAEAPLAYPAMALSRKILDQHLLDIAAKAGAKIIYGIQVSGYQQQAEDFALLTTSGLFAARSLFVATGKHDLRGTKRPQNPNSDSIGYKIHLGLPAAQQSLHDRRIMLIAFRGGYAGLQQISADRLNLCLVLRKTPPAQGGLSWPDTMSILKNKHPFLAACLQHAEPCWPKPLAIGRIPYGFIRGRTDGPWWLGDQAAVIPSVAGAGIGIALRSARLAAANLLEGGTAAAFQKSFAEQIRPVIFRSLFLSRFVLDPYLAFALTGAIGVMPKLLARLSGHFGMPRLPEFSGRG